MGRRKGPRAILGFEERKEDDLIRVVRDEVRRPDGRPGTYATVEMKPAVATLVVDDRGVAVLTRQFRYGLGRESVEVASGSVDDGEEAAEAARRQAKEKLGVEAGRSDDLGRLDPDTSIVRSSVRLFLARELRWSEPDREGTETIETMKVPIDEAVRTVEDGRFTHAPTCVLILRARGLVGS